jgi:voltage-gated potassium channel
MWFTQALGRIFFSLLLLAATLAIGTVGFMWLEKYSFLDAVYMTVITMSTVGYGTIGELSPDGKVFAIILIILSAGTFVYAITTITTFVVEGEVLHLYQRYKLHQQIMRLDHHLILCGLGRNGSEAARELLRQGQPFVAIETNPDVISQFQAHHPGLLVITGDATQEDVLEKAGIHRATGLISSLSTDAENVYITLTAREMNPSLTIVARASHESTINKLKRAGANQVILPNVIGGRRMVNQLTRPSLIEFMDLVAGESGPVLHLEELRCGDNQALAGKTLAEFNIPAQTGVLVLGLKRGTAPMQLALNPQTVLAPDDILIVMGTSEQIQQVKTLLAI